VKEVWVKEGYYYPSIIPDSLLNEQQGVTMTPRYRSFVLYDNLQVYGGFNGSETSTRERNIGAHPCVLSGDLGIPGEDSDNALHILTLSPGRTIRASTVIDGFTFSDGKADVNKAHYLQDSLRNINDSSGAAIYAVSAGVSIRNCTFQNLQAHTGAAIYAGRNTMEVSHCSFENNRAENGGAIALWNQNAADFLHLNFIANRAKNGGAIHPVNSTYRLENAVFDGNTAQLGGAIYQELGSNLQWKNVIFKNNQANKGAAVYDISSRTQLANGLFIYNEATDTAGAIYLAGAQMSVFNATFFQNTAINNAGAIYQKPNPFNLKLQLYNNIFYQNTVAGDVAADDADIMVDPANFFVTHTLSNTFACDTCFSGDPLFLSPDYPKGEDGIFFTPDDGFTLQFDSPLLNKGQWATTPLTDMAGYSKGLHFADPGPYKTSPCITHQYTERLFVKAGQSSLLQDGKSWETAYSDLQKALDVANAACVNISEIWVAKGIYTPIQYPDSLFNARTGRITSPTQKAFYLTGKVSIYGGFEGNESVLTDRNPNLFPSELWGLHQGTTDTTKKTAHVFIISGAEEVLVDGFKFRYSASQSGALNVNGYNINNFIGGGIHITHSYTTLKNNHLYNLSSTRGGSIYALKSQLFGENNHFETNAANFEGGAAYMDSSSMFSKNNRFTNNAMTVGASSLSGGALYLRYSQLNSFGDVWEGNKANVGGAISADFSSTGKLSKGVFHQNAAGAGGAIIQQGSASLQMENLLFTRNTAQEGGAIYAEKTLAANAVTFYGNSSRDVGGAIYTPNGADNRLQLQNVLFAENTSPNGGSDFYRGNGQSHDVQFSFLQENFTGDGNITGIHRFRDTADFIGPDGTWMTHDDGLNLAIGSDAINRGNANAPANDIAGYPRRAVADIGAYEFSICNDYESAEKLFVNVANTALPQDGLSWATAFSRLQDAINLTDFPCVRAREIWMAQGTYHPEYIPDQAANIAAGNELNDRRKTYWIGTKGLQILGGFAEGDTSKTQRNPALKATIIDGDIGVLGEASDNSIHLLVLDAAADNTIIDGIQFRNANANTNGEYIILGRKVSDQQGAIVAKNLYLQINDVSISSNHAKTGAAIFAADARLNLNKVTVSDNTANQGAGLALINTQVQLSETIFRNNTSVVSGGAIYSTNRSSIQLSNGQFQSNKSAQGGSMDVVDQGSLSITYSTFDADSAHNGASIHLSNGTTISIESSVLKNSINGNGAIRADGATLIMNALQMSGHTSYENGAALNIFGNSSIKISNSNFNNNKTSGNGGALYIDAPSPNSYIKECKFADNQSYISGGAIKINNRQLDFIFKDNTFSGNSALQAGGAVSVENGVLYFTKSTFENNIATYGGAIQVLNAFAQHQFNNCTFTGNEAKKAGGAIFINASLYYMNSESVVFEKNLAENGAAFYASPGGTSVIYSCVFFGNRASKSGAGIYFPQKFKDASIVFNSLFIENNAEELGAGIYMEKESGLIAIHNTFYKNNARINGGGHFHEENVKGIAFNNIFLLNAVNGDTNIERARKNIYLSSQNGFGVDYNVMDTCWVQIGFAGCDRSVETGFFDEEDYKGDDGIWMTGDDGLIPAEMNTIRGLGVASLSNVAAPAFDILGASRAAGHDPGAYNIKTLATAVVPMDNWKISAYPNPFSKIVQISIDENFQKDLWVQLLDIKGRVMFSVQMQAMNNLLQLQIPGNLSSGMYVLQVQSAGKQASVLLVKE
jgi:predicted outer membrane repeat protein